jgi:hypothetical protein
MNAEQPTATLPQSLLWLHDAPLFIGEAQIERFHDAVVRPLSKQGAVSAGDTLHLQVCPSGKFDTGTFAYNSIKRAYKHALQLVGTLKSDPDMDVLAIYDK